MTRLSARDAAVGLVAVALAGLPLVTSGFFIEFTMTRVLILGLAASTVIFLSAHGGMVSMAQLLLFGVASFAFGNVAASTGKGMTLGWPASVATVIALVAATAVAVLLGIVSARSTGIYFLMLTLTFAVVGFYFFGQVTTFSGSGGVTGIDPPAIFDGPVRLYYTALVLSVLGYLAYRYIERTPFGVGLQGVRDDPVRMASLGYDVARHRTIAFTIAGFVAGLAGVVFVWWNGQVDPNSIGLGPTIDLLIIAVVGGLTAVEGAWLGSMLFVAANVYLRDIPLLNDIGGVLGDRVLAPERFNTVIGIVLLVVMILSPDGLAGLIGRAAGRFGRPGPSAADPSIDSLPNLTVENTNGGNTHEAIQPEPSGRARTDQPS